MFTNAPHLLDHILVIGFAVLVPLADRFFWFSRFKRDLAAGRRYVRVQYYRRELAWQWGLALAAVALTIASNDRLLPDIGLDLPGGWRFWLGLGLAAVVGLALMWKRRQVTAEREERRALREQLKASVSLLPRSRRDLKWFVPLAITTGICEEILYRGYLIWYVSELTLAPFAIGVSCLLFAVSHLYQSVQQMTQTFVLGLVLVGVYYASGKSLWAPMVVHALVELNGGLLSRELVPTGKK